MGAARVVFEYEDKKYDFVIKDITFSNFWFEEGNAACDCNRSLFIAQDCDDTFPEMDCGSKIKMTLLEEVK